MKTGVVMGRKSSSDMNSREMTDEMKEQSRTLPFYFAFFISCVVLLCLMTSEVRIFSDKGWYLQPMLGPAIGLTVMTILCFVKLLQGAMFFKYVSIASIVQYITRTVSAHRITFWAMGSFYVYVHALSVIGFLLSNLVLLLFMLFISKRLDRFWGPMAVLAAIGIVVVFRMVVGLWMDDVWLYSLLPDAASDFCNMYL